jgi:predicted  nucleic acid-binding Zn-ribbon protein
VEPQSVEETDRYIGEVRRLISNLNDYETEIKRIRKDAADREKMQTDVKIHAARSKKEFDALKAVYDVEFKESNKQLTEAKAKADAKAKDILPEYMEKYQTIKNRCFPPLARMVGSQCTGCNMSLPSGVVKDVQSGKEVECETCGRLLIYEV